eukprot:CAMPEP_0167798382 /NCGR_PEP_ID=MMETSP0111_2-20121227/16283_1 /TAXON_ID=91324 /ORGANISM="Lotharella globosa, Strain CCCM811" /LENGTH=160 /DNA_ID=CAMNT_0007692801 /DNA_START=130 /DNA_END=612 /DNA_ORIENTATION=+
MCAVVLSKETVVCLDDLVPNGNCLPPKVGLELLVDGPATRRLDPNRAQVDAGVYFRLFSDSLHVVRAGSHVESARFDGKEQRLVEKARRDPREELHAPLEKIHVRVEAARLLDARLHLTSRLDVVESLRIRGEETESVEVCASYWRSFRDCAVEFRLGYP